MQVASRTPFSTTLDDELWRRVLDHLDVDDAESTAMLVCRRWLRLCRELRFAERRRGVWVLHDSTYHSQGIGSRFVVDSSVPRLLQSYVLPRLREIVQDWPSRATWTSAFRLYQLRLRRHSVVRFNPFSYTFAPCVDLATALGFQCPFGRCARLHGLKDPWPDDELHGDTALTTVWTFEVDRSALRLALCQAFDRDAERDYTAALRDDSFRLWLSHGSLFVQHSSQPCKDSLCVSSNRTNLFFGSVHLPLGGVAFGH